MLVETYRSQVYISHGYRVFTVKYNNGSRTTIREHRELFEHAVGRKLESDEVVHHIDGNKLNNDLSNLALMSNSQHNTLHSSTGIKYTILTCKSCGSKFKKSLSKEQHRRKKGCAGPFCSQSCAGKYATSNRWNKAKV